MTDKNEHTTKEIEALNFDPEFVDEAAIAIQHMSTRDMAPITEEENKKVLKKIDLWLMPIVPSSFSSALIAFR